MSTLIEGQDQDQAQEPGRDAEALHVMVMSVGGNGRGYVRLAHWRMSEPPVLIPDEVMDTELASAVVSRLNKHLVRGSAVIAEEVTAS